MSEERRSSRHHVWLPVKVDDLKEGIALTHDASPHGVLMVTASTLDVGADVALDLKLPAPHEKLHRLHGRVVRVEPNADDPHGLWPYRMAVELDPAAPELHRLLSIVESLGGR